MKFHPVPRVFALRRVHPRQWGREERDHGVAFDDTAVECRRDVPQMQRSLHLTASCPYRRGGLEARHSKRLYRLPCSASYGITGKGIVKRDTRSMALSADRAGKLHNELSCLNAGDERAFAAAAAADIALRIHGKQIGGSSDRLFALSAIIGEAYLWL